MTPNIIVTRLPLADPAMPPVPLQKRLTDLCEVEHIAGYRLAAAFVVQFELILIFELP